MTTLDHHLERTVLIRARREAVFAYFTDSARFAAWWGAGSTVDGRPGGAIRIRYPNGATASGEMLEVRPPERVVFTYGYDDPAKPIPPGGSRVTVTLEETPEGTLLRLRHDLGDAATRDAHVQGWRYQLAVFANVAAGEAHAGAADAIDRFFAAWSEPDPARRASALAAVAVPDVTFRDAWSCTAGVEDLNAHLAAVQAHMAGTRLVRDGDVRQCQGTALAGWVARGPDGGEKARGTNVFDLAPDGRIARVVGIA
jgi:uncharacterized protein YndB with AHSA1/START domain